MESFTNRIVRELGNKIDAIILYGSAARNMANENSDIDDVLIIIINNFADLYYNSARFNAYCGSFFS